MFTFLLIVQGIIAAALVGVILMQRSEGGGLGMGGSPSGLMSARGAADFLTRATTILATLFVVSCIGLAAYASFRTKDSTAIDTSLARTPVQQTQPVSTDPLAAGGNAAAPAAAEGNAAVPANDAAAAGNSTTPAQ